MHGIHMVIIFLKYVSSDVSKKYASRSSHLHVNSQLHVSTLLSYMHESGIYMCKKKIVFGVFAEEKMVSSK